MSTTPVIPASAEPSMSELRSMIASTAPVIEATPETSAPVVEPKPAAEETPKVAPEPAETKTEPVESEEPLPEGVVKRIAKETERAARAQAAIDRAVSDRKAKEAEASKVAKSGSEPAPSTAQTTKPKPPVFGEAGHESENWDQFTSRQTSHQDARDAWLKAETLKEFQQQTAQQQAQTASKARWDAAVEKHGAEFSGLMDVVLANSPEGLQLAISHQKDWSTVAVHLAKKPEQLKELASEYAQNPYLAIAKLGRIADSLTKETPKPATPLPEPLAKVGGSASVSGKTFQDTLEGGSMSQFSAAVRKARG